MPVTVTLVDHPLVADSLARIRDRDTPNALFRHQPRADRHAAAGRGDAVAAHVDGTVETPLTTAPADAAGVQPVVVPVLRAGLGFVHAAQELMPDADVGFIGISRDEETFQPKPYVNKLPESLEGRPVIVHRSDAGHRRVAGAHRGTAHRTRRPGPIIVVCALAAPEGIQRLRDEGLDLHIFTAAIDDQLNEHAFIVPGLGDAGDRQFGSGG